MRVVHAIALAACIFMAPALEAQTQKTAGDSAARAAVKQLMEVSRVREMTEQTADVMLKSQLEQMPQLGPYANILRDFYREQLGWAVLEPDLTQVYLEVFSESELRELIAFYQSPLGKKMLDKMPVLLAKSNELTSKRMQAAMPKLMERLEAAVQSGMTRPDSTKPKKP